MSDRLLNNTWNLSKDVDIYVNIFLFYIAIKFLLLTDMFFQLILIFISPNYLMVNVYIVNVLHQNGVIYFK